MVDFPDMGGGGNDGNGGAARQRQGRGDRDGGARDSDKSNAAVHSGVAFGFIKELIEMQATDLGAAGYATEWTQNLLKACEKLFGVGATENVIFPGLSALISNGGFFRSILKVVLPNDFLSDIALESIDGYLEGVRTAYHQGGKITRRHHDDALGAARQIIQKRLDQRTVADVLFTLTEVERDNFNLIHHLLKEMDVQRAEAPKKIEAILQARAARAAEDFIVVDEAALEAEAKKLARLQEQAAELMRFEAFNFYRTKMNRREVVLEVLRKGVENPRSVVPYLETLYGPPPKPSKVEGIGHKIVEALEGYGKRLARPATPEQLADRDTKRTAKQAKIDAINASRRTSRH